MPDISRKFAAAVARRRNHQDSTDDRDRWLVSYADFITLLFAFFVVMYAISTLNEGKYRVISDALVHAFRSDRIVTAQSTGLSPMNRTQALPPLKPIQRPAELARRVKEQKLIGIASKINDALKALVQTDQVRLTKLPHGIAVEINASVLFAPGQAALQTGSISALSAVAQVLNDSDNVIKVEGHTDNVPIASAQYPSNWELSSARASSVVRLFVGNGVAPSRLTATGYADNRPVLPNESVDGRSRNRRVTLLILEDAAEPAEN